MEQILHNTLSNASTVILPHFGAIIKLGDGYQFNEFLKYNDGKLVTAVENAKNVSKEKATEIVSDYIRSIKEHLNSDKDFDLGIIGTLSKKSDKIIIKQHKEKNTSKQKTQLPSTDSITKEKSLYSKEELPKAYTSTNLVIDKAIEKLNTLTTTKEINAFTKGEKREQVLIIAKNKKESILKNKQSISSTPIIDNKKSVDKNITIKKTPIEKEDKQKLTNIDIEKKTIKKTIENKNTLKQQTTKKETEKQKISQEISEEQIKENLKAGAIVIEKEAKKRKRNRLILIIAIILLLIGTSIIGFINKDYIYSIIENKEISENKSIDKNNKSENTDKDQNKVGKENIIIEEEKTEQSQDKEISKQETEHIEESSAEEDITSSENTEESNTDEDITQPENTEESNTDEDITQPENIEGEKDIIKNTSSNGKYNIVVGSFSEKTNATTLVNKLQKEGYNNARLLGKFGGLYAVSINNFATRKEAATALETIKSNGYNGWVKKV